MLSVHQRVVRLPSVTQRRVQWCLLLASVGWLSLWLLSIAPSGDPYSTYDFAYDRIYKRSNKQLTASVSSSPSGSPSSCSLPRPDPWDESVRDYIQSQPSPVQCKRLQPELTYLTWQGDLIVNASAVDEAGLSALSCWYRCFWRSGEDDDGLVDGEWIEIQTKSSSRPECEFVEVSCQAGVLRTTVYSNTHAQILAKPAATKTGGPIADQPDVILFVIDSVSRSNFERQLPKTLRVLREQYGAVVMEGLVKVGDQSLPNAVAMLAGKRYQVMGYESELPDDMSGTFADDWPLVWQQYAQRGYATYYAEDVPNINLFRYMAKGFRQQPTDHYLRPYWLRVWYSLVHRRSTHLCYGNRLKHQIQLDYLAQFVHKYSGRPKFALHWLTELSHDWLHQIALGDDDFARFFSSQLAVLNNTWLFVLSDHGHRFDRIRQTLVGRIEERMPFLAVSPPVHRTDPAIQQTLDNNSNILSSFFDVYATLLHILHGRPPTGLSRGSSLLEPLNPDRTCQQAGIPAEFCVCQREEPLDTNATEVQRAAELLLTAINQYIQSTGHAALCTRLSLARVAAASRVEPPPVDAASGPIDHLLGALFRSPTGGQPDHRLYRVAIETQPSLALFEGTLLAEADDWRVMGDINRINRYGNQSHCATTALMKKFCYCLDVVGES